MVVASAGRGHLLCGGLGALVVYEACRMLLMRAVSVSLWDIWSNWSAVIQRQRWPTPPLLVTESSRSRRKSRAMKVLRDVTKIHGTLGMDFGGTLAKCVMAEHLASQMPAEFEDPTTASAIGTTHAELALKIQRRQRCQDTLPATDPESSAASSTSSDDDLQDDTFSMQFMSGPTAVLEEMLVESHQRRRWNSEDHPSHAKPRQVCATGGGAHKLRQHVLEEFNVDLVPVHEMESVIEGLLALHALRPPGSLFTVSEAGTNVPVPWPEELFPLLLINMGSGVSVLRVDGLQRGPDGEQMPKFRRVGGTPCGGATFLGLAKLLTRRADMGFHAALELASRGEAAKVDKLVRDIYGDEGSAHLGLSPRHTAAHFGKLVAMNASASHWPSDESDEAWPSDEDVVASLLDMVSQASAVLAKAHAAELGVSGSRRIFFSGGFVSANPRARAALARNLRALGDEALFLQHSDFLGALGALSRSWPGGPSALRRKWQIIDGPCPYQSSQ